MPRIGDVLGKLGRGQSLAPGEVDTLRLEMNNVQAASALVKGWSSPGKVEPYFNYLEAHQAHFDFIPLEWGGLRSPSSQSLATGVDTPIEWSSVFGQMLAFTWDSANAERISLAGQRDYHAYLIVGLVRFAANATGVRKVTIRSQPSGSSKVMLNVNAAGGGQVTALSYAYISRIDNNDTYLDVLVTQNSGGSLNLLEARVNMARMY